MSGLSGLLVQMLMAVGINWYESTFLGGFANLPETILSFLLSYLVIQLFFYIFPPLKKLMMILGAPFRYMHVALHGSTAKRIAEKKMSDPRYRMAGVGFWGGKNGNEVISVLHPSFSFLDALKIATAPLLGAGALFIFLIASSPLLAPLGGVGLLLHIYLLFCCVGIALPSLSDYAFIVKGSTFRNPSLHPGYILWAYFIFAFCGYLTLQQTSSAIEGFKDGVLYAVIYIVLIFVVSKVAMPSRPEN